MPGISPLTAIERDVILLSCCHIKHMGIVIGTIGQIPCTHIQTTSEVTIFSEFHHTGTTTIVAARNTLLSRVTISIK